MAKPRKAAHADDKPPAGDAPREQHDDDAEPTIHVDSLIESSRNLLGCSPHLAAGALSKGNRKNWTLEDAKERVAEFSKREYEIT